MKIIRQIDSGLGSFEAILTVFLLSVMVLLSFLQVLLREFFSIGILWADTFLRHLVLWVGFLGAAIAVRENGHFAIDLVKKALPPRLKKFAEALTDFFAVVCLLFLAGSALKFYRDELQSRSVLFSVGNFEVPSYWMDLIIPAGFVLLLVHFSLKTFEQVLGIFSADAPRA